MACYENIGFVCFFVQPCVVGKSRRKQLIISAAVSGMNGMVVTWYISAPSSTYSSSRGSHKVDSMDEGAGMRGGGPNLSSIRKPHPNNRSIAHTILTSWASRSTKIIFFTDDEVPRCTQDDYHHRRSDRFLQPGIWASLCAFLCLSDISSAVLCPLSSPTRTSRNLTRSRSTLGV